MSTASTSSSLENSLQDIPVELIELKRGIEALPAEHREMLLPIMERVVVSSSRRRKILKLVQEALGQLRLDMKYLVFDLEATRRERDEYKAQLGGEG
jgi:uncharacterized coiled-coil DUF342 family protein